MGEGPKDSLDVHMVFSLYVVVSSGVKVNPSQDTRCVYAMPIHPSLWRQKSPALLKAIVTPRLSYSDALPKKEGRLYVTSP